MNEVDRACAKWRDACIARDGWDRRHPNATYNPWQSVVISALANYQAAIQNARSK